MYVLHPACVPYRYLNTLHSETGLQLHMHWQYSFNVAVVTSLLLICLSFEFNYHTSSLIPCSLLQFPFVTTRCTTASTSTAVIDLFLCLVRTFVWRAYSYLPIGVESPAPHGRGANQEQHHWCFLEICNRRIRLPLLSSPSSLIWLYIGAQTKLLQRSNRSWLWNYY